MSKVVLVSRVVKWMLIALFAASILGFLSFGNLYGVFWAVVTGVIAVLCAKENRWGFFAAAGWGLACYQLAKQGYEFQDIKRWAMIVGILVVPVALVLHETLGRLAHKVAQESGSAQNNDPKMPD